MKLFSGLLALTQGSIVGRRGEFSNSITNIRALDQNCPDLELGESCITECDATLTSCIIECASDTTCIAQCNREFSDCDANCPCSTNCPTGCDKCMNPLCKRSVLILNTYAASNRAHPVLTDFNGNVNDKLKFSLPAQNTEVYRSCSTVLHGRYYIFGGRYQPKQISVIDEKQCVLRREGDLPREFQYGGCQTFMMPEEKALLCFGYSSRTCMSYDGEVFKDEENSNLEHRYSRLTSYRGEPLAVGHYYNGGGEHNRVELMTLDSYKWKEVPNYPTHRAIYRYATAFTPDATVIIGGRTFDDVTGTGRYVSDIVEFRNMEWTHLGNLKQPRGGIGAIDYQEETLIVGGGEDRPYMSEVWNLDTLENRLVEPELVNYAYYPEMFIVADDFCAR